MEFIECPFFEGVVELTDEREEHISFGHPHLLPGARDELIATISSPDEVVPILGDDKHLFVRWSDIILGGRFVIAVVISDADFARHWIVTAYTAKHTPEML